MIFRSQYSAGFQNARVLLLSAHTDDCELGMGATVARLAREGANMQWHVFSNAVESLPEGFGENTLLDEQRAAADVYGIPQKNLIIHDIPVRRFPEFRQTILDALIKVRNEFKPDLVFCAARTDRHQDHEALAQETFRAFKGASILGYQLPWNSKRDERQLTLEVTQQDVLTRQAAIDVYRSQAHRPYFRKLAGPLLNEFYGSISGYDYAEVFEVISITCPLGSKNR
jgi:LmbE family N-acetylglucosaminyl deacetylase